jgi:hypothetical protein
MLALILQKLNGLMKIMALDTSKNKAVNIAG